MANANGHCFQFEFMENHTDKRTTKTDGTWVASRILGLPISHSTKFWVSGPADIGNPTNGPYDDLTILGTDGNTWYAKIECTANIDGSIDIEVTCDRDRNGSYRNSNWEIVDWEGNHWKVEIDKTVYPNRDDENAIRPVGFTLTKL